MSRALRCFGVTSLLFIAGSVHALTTGPTSLTVSPANPKPGGLMNVSVTSTWSDSCVPRNPTISVVGHTVVVEAVESPCNVGCATVLSTYAFTATAFAPTEPGPYAVEYYTRDCAGRRSLEATTQIVVGGTCDFGHSLLVDRSSLRMGDSVTLTWCDPSWILGIDNQFTVNDYRVYASRSATGPFTEVAKVKMPATQFRFTPDAAGTWYLYVAAHGCMITIAGSDCARNGDTVVVSNVVAIGSATTTGCLPTATTLCLGTDGRFEITTRWRTSVANGDGRSVVLTPDSGYFWFFDPGNLEVTVKVLNACAMPNPSFWVFASGMTNVEVELTVTDTKTKSTKRYVNALGTPFAPILDTNAFSCP